MSFPLRGGIAEAFKSGMGRSTELRADIVVNNDGDNQYRGTDIVKLVKPILDKKAEVVIGCRDMEFYVL